MKFHGIDVIMIIEQVNNYQHIYFVPRHFPYINNIVLVDLKSLYANGYMPPSIKRYLQEGYGLKFITDHEYTYA